MTSFRKTLAIAVFLLVGFASQAFAWGTGGPVEIMNLHVHRDIALNVLNHPDIKWAIEYFDLDPDMVGFYAATEPQYYFGRHPGWGEVRNLQFLNWGTPDDMIVGTMLHVIGDAGVGASHSPAGEIWANQHAEILYEGTAEARAVAKTQEVYTGSYSSRMTQFYDEQMANVKSYKKWYEKTWYCSIYCDPWYWSKTGEILAQKMGHTAMLKYFCEKAGADKPCECKQLDK